MANENKLAPRNPNEVVVPVGKANLVTTQEEIDEALETASHIFRQDNEEKAVDSKPLDEELEGSLNVDKDVPERSVDPSPSDGDGAVADEELVELSEEELAKLNKARPAKFGRDKYGRALNKDKTPRKARNDKGVVRGKYGPRTPKVDAGVTLPLQSPADLTPSE